MKKSIDTWSEGVQLRAGVHDPPQVHDHYLFKRPPAFLPLKMNTLRSQLPACTTQLVSRLFDPRSVPPARFPDAHYTRCLHLVHVRLPHTPAADQASVRAGERPREGTRTTAGVLSYAPQAQVVSPRCGTCQWTPRSTKWVAAASASDYAE